MSDFLSNLVERSLTAGGAVRPQLLSIFEPPSANAGIFSQPSETERLSRVELRDPSFFETFPRSRSIERASGIQSTQTVAALTPNRDAGVSESPGPPASRPVDLRDDTPGEHPAVATSSSNPNEATATGLDSLPASPRIRLQPDLFPKQQTAAEDPMTRSVVASRTGGHRIPRQIAPPANHPAGQPGGTPTEPETAGPINTEAQGASRSAHTPEQFRPRASPFQRDGAPPSSRAIPSRSDAASLDQEIQVLQPSPQRVSRSSQSGLAPADSQRNGPGKPIAGKIVDLISGARGPDREPARRRDVRPAFSRPLSPEAVPFPQQPRDAPPAPAINVTIGRIEVRATPLPAPAKTGRTPAPKPSLDEYLRQRAGGNRR